MSTPPATSAEALDRLARLGGEAGLARVLLLYLENTPRRIRDARDALAEGDGERLRELAYSIHSTSPLVGATGLARLAAAMLTALEEKRPDRMTECLAAMEAELEQVRDAWASRLSAPPATDS